MGGEQVSEREPALRKSGESTRWASSRCKGPEVTTPSVCLRLTERPAAWSTSCQTLSSSRLDKKFPWGQGPYLPWASPHLEALQSHFSSLGLSFSFCKMG